MVYSGVRAAVHHMRCRFCVVFLMMGMIMHETCWDTNKYIIFLHLVRYLFTFILSYFGYGLFACNLNDNGVATCLYVKSWWLY
jgi:hypothetical protein